MCVCMREASPCNRLGEKWTLTKRQVNPQLKGHLRGALNNGATADEIKAVREIVISVCEAAGMRKLDDDDTLGGWGWREQIAEV